MDHNDYDLLALQGEDTGIGDDPVSNFPATLLGARDLEGLGEVSNLQGHLLVEEAGQYFEYFGTDGVARSFRLTLPGEVRLGWGE